LVRASDKEDDQAVRLLCNTLLIDLWYSEFALILSMQPTRDGVSVRDAFYDVLRLALNHDDKVFRVTVYGAAFSLLDFLISEKSNESPNLLKILIGELVDFMRVRGKREHVTEEFALKNF